MTEMSEYEEIVEERYGLVIFLRQICKKYEKMGLLANPPFLRTHFLCFLRSPLHSQMKPLEGHTDLISCLAIHGDKLYSGSEDGSIRVWDTKENQRTDCVAMIEARLRDREGTNGVKSISFHNNKMYVLSLCGFYIRIYETETNSIIARIRRTKEMTVLAIHNNKMFSGDVEGYIEIFKTDAPYKIKIHKYPRLNGIVKSLSFHENQVFALTIFSSRILVGNTEEPYESYTKYPDRRIGAIVYHENKIYCGCSDGIIKVWNTRDLVYLPSLRFRSLRRDHRNILVLCLAVHKNKLYSGSEDRIIRIWNTETHKCIKYIGAGYKPYTSRVIDPFFRFDFHENKLIAYCSKEEDSVRFKGRVKFKVKRAVLITVWNTDEPYKGSCVVWEHTDCREYFECAFHENKMFRVRSGGELGEIYNNIHVWCI